MKKALFIISDLKGGGAQRVITRVVNGLVERGWDIDLVTLNDNQSGFYPLDDRVKRTDLGIYTTIPMILVFLRSMGFLIYGIYKIRKFLKQNSSKVAVSFITKTNIQLILASAYLHNKKIIISERSDPRKQNISMNLRVLRRLVYNHAHLVTANSKGVIQLLNKYLPSHILQFLPNPIIIHNESIASNKDSPYILIVGNLRNEKAHDISLRAFEMLDKDLINWRLRIVGGGNMEEELKSLANDLGISDRVDWIGKSNDVNAHYKEASIFIMPSRLEGMPNALLEAMSFGLPSIVSDASPGLLELVEHEKTGLVVPVENPELLALALKRLLYDPALCSRLGQAARQKVTEFEEERVLDLWENILTV